VPGGQVACAQNSQLWLDKLSGWCKLLQVLRDSPYFFLGCLSRDVIDRDVIAAASHDEGFSFWGVEETPDQMYL
jgi:hypothetical protein